MQLKKGQIVELEIQSIAFGGAGLAKYEGLGGERGGLAVFVHGTMPGDKVRAAFTKIKNNFAEASLVELVKPSADRVEARCPYFGVCGGCQLQFMPYSKQLEMKQQHVRDAFERIGGFKDVQILDIIGCEDSFYYRNKMEFSFGHDAAMNFSLGLHMPERKYDILDVKECYLESELSVRILNVVRNFVLEKGWKPYRVTTGEGFLKSLYIREGKRTGEVMINLLTSSDNLPEGFEGELSGLVKILSGLVQNGFTVTSIYWSQLISRRGQRNRIEEKLLYGKKTLLEKMTLGNGDELVFEILPQAFFQVNTLQAEVLYSQALEFALNRPQKTVFDLFCGTGTIGLFMAKHVDKVLGIELNEDAIRVARVNAETNKVFNIDFYCGDVGKLLHSMKERPSLILVDPPRAGLTEKIISKMNEFGADQIVYVSCNPATLARDCAWFKEYGYEVKKVQPVDMFPHTYHIENVCLLTR